MAVNVVEKPRLPVENTGEQHLACAVLVDTSGSMAGYEGKLEEAIREMKTAIEEDDVARGRVEICLITFDDDVREESPFSSIERMEVPHINCGGMTCTHAAVQFALRRVEERKEEYKRLGITYNQPWIWLLTDGGSNDTDNGSFIELLEAQKKDHPVTFFGVAIGNNVNESELAKMHKDSVILKVSKDDFRAAFKFISQSVSSTAGKKPGDDVEIPLIPGVNFVKITA